MKFKWYCVGVTILLMVVGAFSVQAHSVTPQPVKLAPLPDGPAVISIKTPSGTKKMSLAEIEAIGLFRVSTTTFWPKDDGVYEGVLLSSLLKHVGLADVKELTIWAVDGFSQNIPREDWIMWPILLATRRDGKAMTRRQKGPTRIIYPRDLAPILKDDRYHLRWVWMINKIEKTKN